LTLNRAGTTFSSGSPEFNPGIFFCGVRFVQSLFVYSALWIIVFLSSFALDIVLSVLQQFVNGFFCYFQTFLDIDEVS
jgi:hypothetical protein